MAKFAKSPQSLTKCAPSVESLLSNLTSSKIPSAALQILTTLQQAGFSAYFVGGCVRDMLLGRQPKDFDIATSALPMEIQALFDKTLSIGARYGSIGVVVDSKIYEVTTFRTEGAYSNARSPDSVAFVKDIRQDMRRRDFTMNALTYAPDSGLLDEVGGLEDLARGCIACVGEPKARMQEDALRILRALRFSATLAFQKNGTDSAFRIETATKNALFACKEGLRRVSAERIREELTKLLYGANAAHIVCEYEEIFELVLEMALNSKAIKMLKLPTCVPSAESSALLWAGFLAQVCDMQNIKSAEQILTRLKFDKKTKARILGILELCQMPLNASAKQLRASIINYNLSHTSIEGRGLMGEVLELKRTLEGDKGDFAYFSTLVQEVLDSALPLTLKELCVNGRDILALGAESKSQAIEGKDIGRILETLLKEVASGKLAHTRQSLLTRARELLCATP